MCNEDSHLTLSTLKSGPLIALNITRKTALDAKIHFCVYNIGNQFLLSQPSSPWPEEPLQLYHQPLPPWTLQFHHNQVVSINLGTSKTTPQPPPPLCRGWSGPLAPLPKHRAPHVSIPKGPSYWPPSSKTPRILSSNALEPEEEVPGPFAPRFKVILPKPCK